MVKAIGQMVAGGLATGCVAGPAAGEHPLLAVACGVGVDGDQADIALAQLPALGVHTFDAGRSETPDIAAALSMFLLAKASKSIPIGTAYPVWTGIGAVGTVLIGILVFKEPASFWRLLFITTLIASVVGLKNLF